MESMLNTSFYVVTVEPDYNMVYHEAILHTYWKWHVHDIYKTMNSQKTLYPISFSVQVNT